MPISKASFGRKITAINFSVSLGIDRKLVARFGEARVLLRLTFVVVSSNFHSTLSTPCDVA